MVNPYQTSNKLAGFIRFHWGFITTRNAVTKRDYYNLWVSWGKSPMLNTFRFWTVWQYQPFNGWESQNPTESYWLNQWSLIVFAGFSRKSRVERDHRQAIAKPLNLGENLPPSLWSPWNSKECFNVGHLGLLPLGVALISFFGQIRTSPLPVSWSIVFW